MARTELSESPGALCTRFDVALLDLDGVVYIGPQAVPGVPEALSRAREQGMRLSFVTNNAARTPLTVAEHLTGLGVPAQPDEVTTSAQAAAHYLAERLPEGSAVLVIGTVGLTAALTERGLVPVTTAEDNPSAVVQGYSPELSWAQLAEGAVALGRGLPWVATNLDPTVPSPRGPLPGNGSLVAALRHATGREPVATGKPDPTMHRETMLRSHAQNPIVVGDRLDTDIQGASAVGCASLLVLSGVTDAGRLLAAPPEHRPDYLGRDAGALLTSHPPVTRADGRASCSEWTVTRSATAELTLSCDASGTDHGSPDGLDPLRALCAQAWVGSSAGGPASVRAGDTDSAAALGRLGLDSRGQSQA